MLLMYACHNNSLHIPTYMSEQNKYINGYTISVICKCDWNIIFDICYTL